jgi:acetyl-CoA synthetase
LQARGVRRGDRVGVLRSQDAWCAAAHIAIWKLGAVSIPLFKLFRHDALLSRVQDAGAVWIVTDAEGADMLDGMAELGAVLPEQLVMDPEPFAPEETGPEDPAVLIYTSGTTGSPKGALHGHRMLAGHLPGVEMSHDFLGQDGDCLWTPADWAWIGGLFDVLMPGLALGVPVVAVRLGKFTPEECARIVRAGKVRNVFFPPTALRMLKAADQRIAGLRSVASGGEPLGAEMLEWGRDAFGLTINEFYGQTECNMVASSRNRGYRCGGRGDARRGRYRHSPRRGQHDAGILDEARGHGRKTPGRLDADRGSRPMGWGLPAVRGARG